MTEDLPDIDEAALRKISRIDRAIAKMRRDDQGAFVSITNAIEHHLEIWPRESGDNPSSGSRTRSVCESTRYRPKGRGLRNPAPEPHGVFVTWLALRFPKASNWFPPGSLELTPM